MISYNYIINKVAGSIFDSTVDFFNLHNPSGRTTALGVNQPLTGAGTRNLPWGKDRWELKAENLTANCQLTV
jgi:hypothetical protein